MALLPSRLGRTGAAVFIGAQLLFALELLIRAQPLAAVLIGGMAALSWFGCLVARRTTAMRPRRLLLLADGRVRLQTSCGDMQSAQLLPASLRLGAWMLLLVRTPSGLHRLLLGPDNLEPAQLAALRRRVGIAAGRQDAVLYPDGQQRERGARRR